MKILSILIFTMLSFVAVGKEEYISYKELTRGMKPSEAYVAGANKFIDYLSVNEIYACKFMVGFTYSAHLKKMREILRADLKERQDKGELTSVQTQKILSASDQDIMFNICVEMGVGSEATSERASLDNISKELIKETKAFFRAKFPDGSERTVLMKKEDEVWKVAAIK